MKRDWHGLYKTAAWQRLRTSQLSAEPLCRMCAQDGHVTPATVADHVIPHKGDRARFFEGELQSLCAPHHDSAKRLEELRGMAVGCDERGIPIAAAHHWRTGVR